MSQTTETTTAPATGGTGGAVLGANQYGKAEVRLVRVDRADPRHRVTDLTVTSQLRGDFTAAHTAGDNAHVVATDTQKNTVFAFAGRHGVGSPERYWSRSRACLWHKGDTSGQIQTVVEMRIDCDQDAIVLKVRVGGDGGCCHTGRRSCFYRRVITEPDGRGRLALDTAQ